MLGKDNTAGSNQHDPQLLTSALTVSNRVNSGQHASTTLSTPAGKTLSAPADAVEQPTPTDAAGLPTPLGTVGRAAVPPTPFVPQSIAGAPPVVSAQALGWRNRAYNVAFKGRSPSSSR